MRNTRALKADLYSRKLTKKKKAGHKFWEIPHFTAIRQDPFIYPRMHAVIRISFLLCYFSVPFLFLWGFHSSSSLFAGRAIYLHKIHVLLVYSSFVAEFNSEFSLWLFLFSKCMLKIDRFQNYFGSMKKKKKTKEIVPV